jgi:hypothetical protein
LILYKDGYHSKLFIEIPKGKSKATFIKLRNIVVQIVKYCTDNDEDSVRQGTVKVTTGLESEFKESFLEVTKAKGYSTIQARVLSAKYWTAMVEASKSTSHTTKRNYKVYFPSLWTSIGGSIAQVGGIWITICAV